MLNASMLPTDLSVVASVQSHPVLPEVLEERGQDLSFDVVCFHTISATTLLHHLRDKNRNTVGLLYSLPLNL